MLPPPRTVHKLEKKTYIKTRHASKEKTDILLDPLGSRLIFRTSETILPKMGGGILAVGFP